MDYNTAAKLEDYARLRQDYSVHSAKIHLLQKELDHVKHQQDMLKDQMTPRGGPATDRSMNPERRPEMYLGETRTEELPRQSEEEHEKENEKKDKKPNQQDLEIYYGYGERDRMPKERPHSDRSVHGRPGMYFIPLDKNDTGKYQTMQRGEENKNEYRERRPEMYHGQDGDYWNDKHGDDSPGKNGPDDRNFDFEDLRKKEREKVYSFYDSTAINPQDWKRKETTGQKYPWYDHQKIPDPGGLGIMRFRDSGFDLAKVAIQQLQSIMRTTGGYMMGMARKDRIFVYETAAQKELSWVPAREQDSKFMRTEDAVAVFWFASREAANNFYTNRHQNRFKEPGFPDANGHEFFYIPLIVPPSAKPMPTFMFIEILNARQYERQNSSIFTQFESELGEAMLRFIPTCLPIVSSSLTGRQYLKPGTMVNPYSRLFVSRFDSQRHADEVWKSGIIQGLREKYGLMGQMNVASFTLSEVR